MLNAFHKLYLLLPVLSRHIRHLLGDRLVLFSSSGSPVISGKVTEAFPFTPSGYKMAAKTLVWALLVPHP